MSVLHSLSSHYGVDAVKQASILLAMEKVSFTPPNSQLKICSLLFVTAAESHYQQKNYKVKTFGGSKNAAKNETFLKVSQYLFSFCHQWTSSYTYSTVHVPAYMYTIGMSAVCSSETLIPASDFPCSQLFSARVNCSHTTNQVLLMGSNWLLCTSSHKNRKIRRSLTHIIKKWVTAINTKDTF